jgi:hypothetical protein
MIWFRKDNKKYNYKMCLKPKFEPMAKALVEQLNNVDTEEKKKRIAIRYLKAIFHAGQIFGMASVFNFSLESDVLDLNIVEESIKKEIEKQDLLGLEIEEGGD